MIYDLNIQFATSSELVVNTPQFDVFAGMLLFVLSFAFIVTLFRRRK